MSASKGYDIFKLICKEIEPSLREELRVMKRENLTDFDVSLLLEKTVFQIIFEQNMVNFESKLSFFDYLRDKENEKAERMSEVKLTCNAYGLKFGESYTLSIMKETIEQILVDELDKDSEVDDEKRRSLIAARPHICSEVYRMESIRYPRSTFPIKARIPDELVNGCVSQVYQDSRVPMRDSDNVSKRNAMRLFRKVTEYGRRNAKYSESREKLSLAEVKKRAAAEKPQDDNDNDLKTVMTATLKEYGLIKEEESKANGSSQQVKDRRRKAKPGEPGYKMSKEEVDAVRAYRKMKSKKRLNQQETKALNDFQRKNNDINMEVYKRRRMRKFERPLSKREQKDYTYCCHRLARLCNIQNMDKLIWALKADHFQYNKDCFTTIAYGIGGGFVQNRRACIPCMFWVKGTNCFDHNEIAKGLKGIKFRSSIFDSRIVGMYITENYMEEMTTIQKMIKCSKDMATLVEMAEAKDNSECEIRMIFEIMEEDEKIRGSKTDQQVKRVPKKRVTKPVKTEGTALNMKMKKTKVISDKIGEISTKNFEQKIDQFDEAMEKMNGGDGDDLSMLIERKFIFVVDGVMEEDKKIPGGIRDDSKGTLEGKLLANYACMGESNETMIKECETAFKNRTKGRENIPSRFPDLAKDIMNPNHKARLFQYLCMTKASVKDHIGETEKETFKRKIQDNASDIFSSDIDAVVKKKEKGDKRAPNPNNQNRRRPNNNSGGLGVRSAKGKTIQEVMAIDDDVGRDHSDAHKDMLKMKMGETIKMEILNKKKASNIMELFIKAALPEIERNCNADFDNAGDDLREECRALFGDAGIAEQLDCIERICEDGSDEFYHLELTKEGAVEIAKWVSAKNGSVNAEEAAKEMEEKGIRFYVVEWGYFQYDLLEIVNFHFSKQS